VTRPSDAQRRQREHGPYLRALASRLCRSQLDPEPLVREVLERTPRASTAGAGERAWFARALYELFIDKLMARQAIGGELAETVEDAKPPPDEQLWWQGLTADDVRARIARLPDEERAAFEPAALDGASHADLAARLGITADAVGARILRARQRLRRQLAGERGGG
jgi:RNA polymerase sigma factor (sigma-70 family)